MTRRINDDPEVVAVVVVVAEDGLGWRQKMQRWRRRCACY